MKILLHGATDFGSSNFGDFIYGEIYHSFIKKILPDSQISFYNPSDYFKNYVRNYDFSQNDSKNAELLIYFSGGYFGEGNDAKFKHNLMQFYRFMPVGLKSLVKKRDIIVSGIGAGPNTDFLLTQSIKAVCRNAKLVTVRDQESKVALENLGVTSVVEGADSILSFDYSEISERTEQVDTIISKASGKKLLFIHFNHSEEALEKFAKVIDKIRLKTDEYYFVVGSDQILADEDEKIQRFKDIVNVDFVHFRYNSPFELVYLLQSVDNIITCKLHVGVLGTLFNKSVICVAEHPSKSKRYYNRIGYSEHCISLYESSDTMIYELFLKTQYTKISIPADELAKAKLHYDLLEKKLLDYAKQN